MVAYESPVSYKIIYVFSVPYEDHAGLLKVGDTTLKTSASIAQLPPNCELLKAAACKRIDRETKTAKTKYDLLYTEIAVKNALLDDGSTMLTSFRDYDVNRVLSRSGYPAYRFYDTDRPSEWYPIALQTAINAIKAVKEGRDTLTEAEKTEAKKTDTKTQDTSAPDAIVLREEQRDAVDRAKTVFRRKDDMLWDCKMRFGKTVSACTLVKECGFQKTLVVTHRPVVADGWQKDFHIIFGDSDDHVFQTKIRGGQEVDFDERIDAENAHALRNLAVSGKHFMYFASMQDLRESERVKPGGYKKNDVVFDMDWDLIIYDEAHEGMDTELGKIVRKLLNSPKNGKSPKVLSLTGTAYNIIDRYDKNDVYTWDYVMEQRKKREWEERYPGVSNPYADLPELRILTFDMRDSMPDSYRFESADIAFNFREFFRTWTGDPKQDYRALPEGKAVGSFVHEDDVKTFLNLITTDDADSLYPFSTDENRKMFKHTFWMVPGVKAAAALAELLRRHPVFMHYKIANVAGDGDEEKAYDDALKEVRAAIKENPYTITISCGRLTTGVTVPEWTAVMMLTGSANTSASSYMQTIFRVQSAGCIDGKQKEVCYAFDFAPDRAIQVIAEVHAIGKKRKGGDETGRVALGEFLNYCSVLSIDGSGMHTYDVPKMMRQIKRMTVDKAIRSGFDDESVYKSDTGIVMDEKDVELFKKLGSILSGQKQAKLPKKIQINDTGLTGEEHNIVEKAKNKPKHKRTPEEEELLKKEREQRKERDKAIQLLRNVSIRLPLLIYGADVDITEAIHMQDFVTLVDDDSWNEFMPKDVTKELFLRLLKYYDEDVVVGAGLRIRRMAKAADDLPPTQRVLRIAEIFSMFRNPDKETVLTPWRVVNMHLSDMLGGFCFYDETFHHPDGLLDEPRLVDRGDASDDVLLNPDAAILEMNSKSGLYPLYMAYSIYAMQISGRETDLPMAEIHSLWKETVKRNIYVLCKTKMARQITIRTLIGYQPWPVNVICLSKLSERMKDMPRLANKLRNPATWNKEGEKMRFDAVVGNPPYQEMDGGASNSAVPIYQNFVRQAIAIDPHYISMIMPSRWMSGGRGLDTFRDEMLKDHRISVLHDYIKATDCFPTVEIKGGICYLLWNKNHNAECSIYTHIDGQTEKSYRFLDDGDSTVFIRSMIQTTILEKVKAKKEPSVSLYLEAGRYFGFHTKLLWKDELGELQTADGKASFPVSKTKVDDYTIKVYVHGGECFIQRKNVIRNNDAIDSYKVLLPRSGNPNGTIIGKPIISEPGSCNSNTYSVMIPDGGFPSKSNAENFVSYCKTKFFRLLVLTKSYTQMLSPSAYEFVPMQDFSHSWDDSALYRKYGLSQEEISYIESTIRPMD